MIGDPMYLKLTEQRVMIEIEEQEIIAQLKWAIRRHRLGPFVKHTTGLGEKTVARLLGCIGDPSWNDKEQRLRRGPAELWAYRGFHVIEGVAPRRRSGEVANWNAEARKRCHVIAEGCVKATLSPYRVVDDREKAKASEAVHLYQCQNSKPRPGPGHVGAIQVDGGGTRANPELGEPGPPLRPGHQHARAMRAVSKAILTDLYRVSIGQAARYGQPLDLGEQAA